jgi:hypothetical protein
VAPRSYSSAATPDDAVSTEGIDFTLDGVRFVCHGRISAFDLSEFAGPAADADNDLDPALVRILADLMRMVCGEQTYREITRHRRAHHTPDEVIQQILMDVVEAAASRPSTRPSPSPGGRRHRAPALAGSPSPAGPAPAPGQDQNQDQDPEWETWSPPPSRPAPASPARLGAGALALLAEQGDITFAEPPPTGAPAAVRAAPPGQVRVRRLSLAHPERPVQVTYQDQGETG